MNNFALVVDGRTRSLNTFVASVTQAQEDNPVQLVLRCALQVGDFPYIFNGGARVEHGSDRKTFVVEMPVILMGQYSAASSGGHVSVRSADDHEAVDSYRKVVVVGGLGKPFNKNYEGLRILGRPISGTLVRGPVRIERLQTFGNSNAQMAYAVQAGMNILVETDKRSVFLTEGQSDTVQVFSFRSRVPEGTTTFPAEHQRGMFSRESVLRYAVFSSAYHDLVYGSFGGEERPSDEDVVQEVKRRLRNYLLNAYEVNALEHLGRRFNGMMVDGNILVQLARELGVNLSEESVTA